MIKPDRMIKCSIFMLLITRFLREVSAWNPLKSGSSSDSTQSSSESQSEQGQDPFKTTFEDDLVNLDINSLHGYSKFNCNIDYTEVKYQSANKFKSALDGNKTIWEASGTNAFRFTLQFLDKIPLTLMVELDRSDKSTASYYRRKYNSTDWESIDENTHNEFIKKFKKKLEEHKESIKNETKNAVDLNLKIENYTEVKFEFYSYKSNENKVSEGTEAAKSSSQNITNEHYKLTNSSTTDGTEVTQKQMEIEITDKKYRIVKIQVKSNVGIHSDAWKTGGTAYCTKLLVKWEDDKVKETILTLTYKDSAKRTELTLNVSTEWKFLYKFEEKKETDLPTFDFQY